MTWKQFWIIAIITNTVAIGFIWLSYHQLSPQGSNSASAMDISDIILQLSLPSILAVPVVTGVTFHCTLCGFLYPLENISDDMGW